MTFPALNNVGEVVLLVAGSAKAQMVAEALEGSDVISEIRAA